MRIGVPRETKDGERRVGIVPDGARALVAAGHRVIVEAGAGAASGFGDAAYRAAGATIADDAADAWRCPLIVKVKEIQRDEIGLLVPSTTIFGFAQLNRDRALLDAAPVARHHFQRMERHALRAREPCREPRGLVGVHQEPHAAAVDAVDRHAPVQEPVQRLQHEAVAAQRHDRLGLLRRRVAVGARKLG